MNFIQICKNHNNVVQKNIYTKQNFNPIQKKVQIYIIY